MKTEYRVLIYSMLNNLLISILKVVGGLFYGLGSLLSDGLHTFSDFITDVICVVGAKLSRKKPTKYHPFGFGKVEYLTNLFVGIILFLLSILIIINSIFKEVVIPPLSLFYILGITFVLKIIAIIIMHKVGSKVNSQVLITVVEESKADLYSTIGVAIITVVLQFSNEYPILDYFDIIGSIIIGLIVLKTALKITVDNSLSLIGEVEENPKIKEPINDILNANKKIRKFNYQLIKYGVYYKLQLMVELDPKLSLRQVTNVETKLRKELLGHRKLGIKYLTIYVTDHLK